MSANLTDGDKAQLFHRESIAEPLEGECTSTLCITLTTIPMSLVILFILIGNSLVITAILTQRILRTPSNIIILSMAFADLAVGIFILPLNIADMIHSWRFGKVLCRIWLTSDVTLCSTSILHISAIAVDRFRSINEGVAYAQSRSIRMSLVVCGALWLIAIWIASAPVLGWNDWHETMKDGSDVMQCYLTKKLGYIVHSASGAFFIPAAIMVALYCRIFILIRNKLRGRAKMASLAKVDGTLDKDRSSGDLLDEDASTDATKESLQSKPVKNGKKLSFDQSYTTGSKDDSNNDEQSSRKLSEQIENIVKSKLRFSLTKERKAAKTLGILMGAFILCWTPFTMVYLASGVLAEMSSDGKGGVPYWLFQLVTWIGYVNAALNPVIYTVYNPDFRRAFKHIMNQFKCR